MENIEIQQARRIIEETGTNLFLTGKAGTGKTTFLKRLRNECPKRMIVLAPTGIAAINAGGVTLHSFFQLPFAPFIPGANYNRESFKLNKQKIKLIRSTDLIVIDEISMVRADLLDHVDAVLRRYRERDKPFGGIQLLMIGDLQQLAPVVKEEEWALLRQYYDTPFFFDSRALRQTHYATIELQHVYRQSDPAFVELLNRIRSGQADDSTLQALNTRYIPGFNPPQEDGYIRLVTHNAQAQQINSKEMEALPGQAYRFRAGTEGVFPESSYPTDGILTLKRGAQVMFVKNDPERRYFNGMLGKVDDIADDGFSVRPFDDPHTSIRVKPTEWTNARFALNEQSMEIEEQIEGVFRQYPVKAAWAITIHKSQGLTFERAVIDAHSAFSHGQTYVALSRLKSLGGLVLSSPIPANAVINDASVCHYMQDIAEHALTGPDIDRMGRDYYLQTVSGLFDFRPLSYAIDHLLRVINEHFYKLFPDTLEKWEAARTKFRTNTWQIAQKFHTQFERIIAASAMPSENAELQERLRKGAAYFTQSLQPLTDLAGSTTLPTDNKEIKKRGLNAIENLNELLREKNILLEHVAQNGLHLREYLQKKAVTAISDDKKPDSGKKMREKKQPAVRERIVVPSDIRYPQFYQQLIDWRYAKAKEEHIPAYVILQQKALIGIANLLPDTAEALKSIPYFGEKGFAKYGKELLDLVCRYLKESNVARPEIQKEAITVRKGEIKEKTWEISLRLFREGMSIDDIATERLLTRQTVFKHLCRFLPDTVKITELVTPEKLSRIILYLNRHKDRLPTWEEMRHALGNDIQYHEVEAVKQCLEANAAQRPSENGSAPTRPSETNP